MLLRRATALRCWDEEHTGTTQNTFNRDAELHLASPAGHSRKRPTLMVHSPIPSCNANCVCYLRLGVFTVSLEWMPLKRYTVSTVLPASVGTAAVCILLHVCDATTGEHDLLASVAQHCNVLTLLNLLFARDIE